MALFKPLSDIGHGLWKAQIFTSALDLKIFDFLGNGEKSEDEILESCGIKNHRGRDFLNSLVAMDLLNKDPASGKYSNSESTQMFLVQSSPDYTGLFFQFRGRVEGNDFAHLTQVLKGENVKNKLTDFNAAYDADPNTPKFFGDYMKSCITFVSQLLPQRLDQFWKSVTTFTDIGGGTGYATIELCKAQTHLIGTNTDLGQCKPVYDEYTSALDESVKSRVNFKSLDFFKEEFPKGQDVIMMGNVIHDWSDEVKFMLIKKAHDALESGKHILIYDFLIDEKNPKNTLDNFLISVHMQTIATGNQFTSEEITKYLTDAGFKDIQIVKLDYNESAIIGTKI
ncbi:hypothetical protein FGO68_gene15830 [Halteria grandinella]|uniref:Methyltransferase n=1 Tax=Halteria grandinella TaxID=5974 RepID=A0A8J8NT79_HALGN|nr:hypothetical protein FGO68_gene15830 [Halteria grandinella]